MSSDRTQYLRLESEIDVAITDFGGDGPLVLLHHASGFCARVWRTIAVRLSARYRVVGFDARGHGDSSKPDEGYGWDVFAEDLARVARGIGTVQQGAPSVFAVVGHSLGGIAAWLAASRHPGMCERLVLFDPVLITDAMAARFAKREAGGPPPASLTTRMRQPIFASREHAFATLSQQPLYAQFDPAVLEDYLEGGLRLLPDGRVELKCPPRIEASIYALGTTRGAFPPDGVRVPVLLGSARNSRFYEAHALVARDAPSVLLTPLDGGHLMPMEQPALVASIIEEFLCGPDHKV